MFKKVSVYELGYNPFQEINHEWNLITAKNSKGEVNTMTASWGAQGILWGKPTCTVYVRQSRYTKTFIDDQDYFTVSLFDGNTYRKQLTTLGRVSGRDTNKIKDVDFHIAMLEDQPSFEEAKAVFVCKKMSAAVIDPKGFIDPEIMDKWYKDGDLHTMYVGEITQILAR